MFQMVPYTHNEKYKKAKVMLIISITFQVP